MSSKLPDFLVIGGMRCGSTTLHNVLSFHPQLFVPEQKELHYFDGYNADIFPNIEEYKKVFQNAGSHQLCGEITPDYLTTPSALKNISNIFQELKIVVILREPVARVCSHYLMSCATGFEVLPFDKAIESEQTRLLNRNKIADIFHSYKERSTYLPRLEKYAERFGRHNIHVIFLEELNKTPSRELAGLWSFLEVDNLPEAALEDLVKPSNKNEDMFYQNRTMIFQIWHFCLHKLGLKANFVRKKPFIRLEDKQILSESFNEHNLELSQWLGRELPWAVDTLDKTQ